MSWPDWAFPIMEEFIQERGDKVVVETGIACPCRAEDTYASIVMKDGHPARIRRMDCPQCNGDGLIYRNARCVTGLITSVNPGHRHLISAGYVLPGDCTFSPSLRACHLTEQDKVTFTRAESVNEGQVILRGAHLLDTNRTIITDLKPNEDRLWYNVQKSLWCEDANGVVYTQDADFTITENRISWKDGFGPEAGTFYTIKYTAFIEWCVYDSPVLRTDRARDLGDRVLLRRKHVIFTKDIDRATPAQRQAQEQAFTTRRAI